MTFNKNNTSALQNDSINALYEDRSGTLWIGTRGGGLTSYGTGEFKTYTTADGLAGNHIRAICEDAAGNLWIGAYPGLSRLKDGKFESFNLRESLPSDLVRSLYADADGTIWIGTNRGLGSFRDGRFTSYNGQTKTAGNEIWAIRRDRDGDLWFAIYGGGVGRFRNESFELFSTRHGLAGESVAHIYQDRAGNLWFAASSGLSRWRGGGRFESLAVTDEIVRTVAEDSEGNLWFGTYGGGLHRLKDGSFTAFAGSEGLSADFSFSIYEDREKTIWVGAKGGLARYKDGVWRVFTKKDGLIGEDVLVVTGDSAGNLWVGTSNGLNCLKNGKFTALTVKDGLSHQSVRSLYSDDAGNLWIGTFGGGLNRLDKNGKFTVWTGREGLSNDNVTAIAPDADGSSLWLGTEGGGLNCFDGEKFTVFNSSNGLGSDVVRSLYRDGSGALWIGTYGGGLARLKEGKFSAVSSRSGLFDDAIYSILEDDQGNFWLGGNKGVSRISRQELEDFFAGRQTRVNGFFYDASDGMKSSETNGIGQPAARRMSDGQLWFPTTKGVAVVDPSRVNVNAQPPTVLIENFTADGEPVKLNALEPPNLKAGTGRMEFNYTAFNFGAPEKLRFRYRLEGFDPDWIEANSRRSAFYTNLPPGDYRFRVTACNGNGFCSKDGQTFAFTLLPRFYQTTWFYALCALALVLAFYVGYIFCVRQMQRKFALVLSERLAERNRVAREIHDTFLQGVVGVGGLLRAVSKTMSKSPKQATEYLEQARLQLNNSLNEARAAIWDLRLGGNEERRNLSVALREMVCNLTAQTELEVTIETEDPPPDLQLAPHLQTNIIRIAQEAIVNSVSHADAKKLTIELNYDGEVLHLRVADDGRGFDSKANGNNGNNHHNGHFGLIGMRERAAEIGGRFDVRSIPQSGTEVSLRLELKCIQKEEIN